VNCSPAKRRRAGLSGCSSICRVTYCPSKWAYHKLRLPPAVVSFSPGEKLVPAPRTKGTRKYLCELAFMRALTGARGTRAAEINKLEFCN